MNTIEAPSNEVQQLEQALAPPDLGRSGCRAWKPQGRNETPDPTLVSGP
jgi:hypothetical protein